MNFRFTFVLAVVAITTTTACPPSPAKCGASDPTLDASKSDQRDACDRAGARLSALKCPEARPDFVEFCLSTLDAGIPLQPICISQIAACSGVEACR